MKTCCTCRKEKEIEEFGNNQRNKDGKQRQCKDCQAIKDNLSYLKSKAKYKLRSKHLNQSNSKKFEELKKTLKCSKCGDDRHYVLDFHHTNPENKLNTVSNLVYISWKRVEEEINKCVVLCANCHREEHYIISCASGLSE